MPPAGNPSLSAGTTTKPSARVVELRVFGGLTVQETASVLKVSTDTVGRDWSFAKSWLKRALKK